MLYEPAVAGDPPIFLASVHPPETESPLPDDPDLGSFTDTAPVSVAFRHSGWKRVRGLIWNSLHRTRQKDGRRQQFKECGGHAYVLRSVNDPTRFRLAGSACHDRFCLPCANERANTIALNILDVANTTQTRFLTLTLKSGVEPLVDLLNRLYACFQVLRRRKFWQTRVKGGVAMLEITYNASSDRWHPHFHVLIEGLFLPQKQIRAAWLNITKDSSIVDIRHVKSASHAVRYVTKYASKPFDNTYVNRPERLDEAMIALHGRKLCLTFGSWRGVLLAGSPSDDAWEHVASLERVLSCAALGDVDCQQILHALTDRDLTDLYARAPPVPAQRPPPRPCDEQLHWFGEWRRDGTWHYYGL